MIIFYESMPAPPGKRLVKAMGVFEYDAIQSLIQKYGSYLGYETLGSVASEESPTYWAYGAVNILPVLGRVPAPLKEVEVDSDGI